MADEQQPFDDRDGQIWFDGRLVPWRDAQIHVLSHAMHYASAVFEGERLYDGEIFRHEAHIERFFESARVMGFEIPYSKETIEQACRDTAAANNLQNGYVRPIAWRGPEQMGVSAQQTKIHVAIAVWAWPNYFTPEARMRGLQLGIAEWKRPSPECAPIRAKATGLYMICTLSKHKAEAAGYQDALMLDYRGQVAESTGSNIFFVKDGVIHTPVPDCFLDGITRQEVIRLARERGLTVTERAIMPEEMADFEQCFLTGTAVEVTPVSEIGPYNFEVGDITKTLMTDFDNMVWRRDAA